MLTTTAKNCWIWACTVGIETVITATISNAAKGSDSEFVFHQKCSLWNGLDVACIRRRTFQPTR